MATYRDTFAGISAPTLPVLETNIDTLNTQKGTVAAVGGLIKGYQDTQEANKLANFNNTLTNMSMEGNVDGLKQLANFSNQFTDATNRTKAFTSAVGAVDSTASTQLLNEAEQKYQAGDLQGYQNTIAKAQGAGLSPKTTGTVLSTLQAKLPDLTVASTIRGALAGDEANLAAQTQRNQDAFTKVFATNPAFSQHFDLVKGEPVEKQLTMDDVRRQVYTESGGKLPLEMVDAAAKQKLPQLELERAALRQKLFSGAMAAGAAPIESQADKTGKDVISKLAQVPGISVEKATAAGQTVSALRSQAKQLGAEGQVKLAAEVNPINLRITTELDLLKQKFAITQKLNDSEIDNYIKQRNSTSDDFFKAIEAIDPKSNIISSTDNRDSALKVLTPLIGQKITIKDIDGKEVTRTPTWTELGNAVKLAQDMPWWSSERKTVDDTKLIPLLKQAMATNNAYNKVPATEVAFKEITDYVKESMGIKTKGTADILNATQRINAQEGVGDYSISNKRLQDAAAALTKANTLPTAGSVDPVQATKKKLFDTSQAVTSPAASEQYLAVGKERITSLAQKLQKEGLNKEQAAGVIGSLQGESGPNLDPKSFNNTGGGQGAKGISQWRADRITALEKFTGKKAEQTSFDEQTNFLIKELKDRGDWEKIKKAKTPSEAAVIHEQTSLRAGVGANHERRSKFANNVFAGLNG
jgi:hypothetical protein